MKKTNKEEYQDFQEIIDDSKRDFSEYIDKRLALIKLTTYEKLSNFSSRLLYGVIVLMFVVIISILIFLTLGLYIGYLLNNYAAGFGILIVFSILILILIIANNKRIRGIFQNLTLRTIKKIENDED